MERINFRYVFREGNERHEVTHTSTDENDEGLNCANVCSSFVEFMTSIGFSEENILAYFNH